MNADSNKAVKNTGRPEYSVSYTQLLGSARNLEFAVSAAGLGTFYCDWPLNKIIWNSTCKKHFFLPEDAEIDFELFYSLLHPDDLENTRLAIERAAVDQVEYNVEYRTCGPNGEYRWLNAIGRFLYDPVGQPVRFDGITIDISERKSSDIELKAAHERTSLILESITEGFFAVDREWRFTHVNAQTEHLLGRTRESLIGRGIWDEFPNAVGSPFYRMYHRAMETKTPQAIEEYSTTTECWLDARAYPDPHGLSIFLKNVDSRKHAEAERERLIASERARAEREALLNRIGQVLRDAPEAEAALETTVSLLGEALRADRCYFAIYDFTSGVVRVGRDWHRSDLPSVRGTHAFANTAEMFHELYKGSSVSTIFDAYDSTLSPQTIANMESLQLRSRISIALQDLNGIAATLTAAMSNEPRQWTQRDASLLEAAGPQLRVGIEAARLRQREHKIATQLQEGLQPDVPEHIPGLSIGKFAMAALDEANVGGDFYDIFEINESLYALVIGDVSGKGLAAAQQLALIRNCLRTTLYLYRDPVEAADKLNTIVTAHKLLTGFVTIFVSLYDAASGKITYCSCGHEPALLRRATGEVEALQTSGPPVGIFDDPGYRVETTFLSSGDSLLLYTDGLSEAGPSRRELLGTDGLMRIFGAGRAKIGDVQAEAEDLIADVNAYANGIFRDDVAVLLVRRV